MITNKKTTNIVVLLVLVILTTASTVITGPGYKNLKVLPKDINERQMDSIMSSYTQALKVSCDFCHVPAKKKLFTLNTAGADTLDYALDNPMKEEARRMIRMSIDINKNYFYSDSSKRPEYLNVVSCNTCHRGNPYPANE